MAKPDGALLYSPQAPDGTFLQPVPLGIKQPDAKSISVGDLNQDGLPDLAVATNIDNGHTYVYFNQP